MRRLIACGAVAAIGVVLTGTITAQAAVQADRSSDSRGQIVNGSPEAVVVVGRSSTLGSWTGTPRGGARWTCGYYAFLLDPDPYETDGGMADVRYDDGPVDPEPGELYVLACHDADGRRVRSLLQQYDPADPLGPIAATERALDEARRRLDLPLPSPGLNPPGAQLVGVPTWLWLDGAWGATSATATVANVSATVTARPVRVEWDTGDGTTLTCDGPGTPYDPSRPASAQSSDCTHVYGRASGTAAGGAYQVRVTVIYEAAWTSSSGPSGDLGTLERTTTVPVQVLEAQALLR